MIAELVVNAAFLYVTAGLAFAAWFVTLGVLKIDPAAKGSGTGFRALIIPGTVALWPFLLKRCLRK